MEAEGSVKEPSEQETLEGRDVEPEEQEEPQEAEEQEEPQEAADGAKKRVVPGIVYLGHIPPRFRPLHVRNLLSAYGEVGRVFFQPEEGFVRRKKKAAAASAAGGKKRSKYSKDYTEGWVEFRDKRVAKRVAASLHNTPMGARRRSPFRYDLWNLKVSSIIYTDSLRGISNTVRQRRSIIYIPVTELRVTITVEKTEVLHRPVSAPGVAGAELVSLFANVKPVSNTSAK